MSLKFSPSLTEVFEYLSYDSAVQMAKEELKSNSSVGSMGKYG